MSLSMVALASSEARAAAFFPRIGAGALASAISTGRRTASDAVAYLAARLPKLRLRCAIRAKRAVRS